MSLRRLRYQLHCARSGHDVRPYMIDGSRVAQRCLRCGAIVDGADSEAAGEAADVVLDRRIEPQPSRLPPAPADRHKAADHEALEEPDDDAAVVTENGAEPDDESTAAALAALRELGELHAAGVLTDGEFARKKAELLRRV